MRAAGVPTRMAECVVYVHSEECMERSKETEVAVCVCDVEREMRERERVCVCV